MDTRANARVEVSLPRYWEAHEPFGGASGTRSGWGRIGGRYTMLDMTDLKTVVLDVGGLE